MNGNHGTKRIGAKAVSYTHLDVYKRQAGKVSLAMTASADKTAVAKNTDVTFSFAIENKGNVKVENCQIKASNLNGGKVIESFSLDSGKSKLVTYTGEVVKDMEITPTITYTAKNKNYTEKMNKITVKVTDAVLDVKISPQSTTLTAGESTEVDVTLKNTGNTNLKNIVLYDNSDNKVVLPSASLDLSLIHIFRTDDERRKAAGYC